MKLLLFVVALVLVATTASAQPVCRTIVLPDQEDNFRTAVTVPAHTTVYPLLHLVRAHTTVGLEFWAHKVHSGPGIPDPPKGVVDLWGFIVTYPAQTKNLVMPQSNRGPADDGIWHVFAMSTFLHLGEYFTVGVFNRWTKPVTVDLAITIRECVVP